MSAIRAAVVQAAPAAFDTEATLSRLAALLPTAAEGADLVILPEAYLGGYPKGMDFGVRIGSRSPEGRAWFERYAHAAIAVPGPVTDAVGELVRAAGVHLVIGAVERERGTLYCAALVFGPDGALIGARRKLVPTGLERVIWGQGGARDVRGFATELGVVGAAICWESYMPRLREALYGLGVELYCAPTVDDREVWLASMRHIAVEGRCFVLSACQYATRADFPSDYPADAFADALETVLIAGGSCIVDPFGTVLAGPARGGATIVRAELDRGAIVRGKYDLDVAGHYARRDLFP
jgi:predicted amidohydrolase